MLSSLQYLLSQILKMFLLVDLKISITALTSLVIKDHKENVSLFYITAENISKDCIFITKLHYFSKKIYKISITAVNIANDKIS